MKPFFKNILLFLIFISISSAEIKYIDEQFDLCEYDTQRPINYEIITNSQLNELNLFSKLEDEYNYFSFGKPRPIYSSYGIIYECNCTKINGIAINTSLSECKKNIPVMHNGQKYYLTACGILRKDDTKATKCSYKINYFKTKKFLVFKLNKLIRNSTNTTIPTIENFFNLLSENSLETFQTSCIIIVFVIFSFIVKHFIYPCKKEDENTDLEIQVDNNSNTVHNNPNEVDNKQISIFSNQNLFRHHTNEFTTNPVLQIIQPTGIQRNSNQLAIIDKNQDFTMNENGLVTCKFIL
jgi:hypothetical protein